MAAKKKNLFLYLTLACFLGIVAIFVFDGYMGIYDSLAVTAGEREEKVEADYWLRADRWFMGVNWGDRVGFEYEVDNRLFSSYSAEVEVSLWQRGEKMRELSSRALSVPPFGKESLGWAVDTEELKPEGPSQGESAQYTLVIKRGEVERRVILDINPSIYPPKPVPVR